MNLPFTLGRIAVVLIFIFSGVQKLMDIAGTANQIRSKVVIPAELSDLALQFEATVGIPIWQALAIIAAIIEVLGGVLIAFNVRTRTMAVVLLLFAAVTTVYFHDFWNLPAGPERVNNMFHALKNLSIVGALLMLAAWPRRPVIVASRVGAALTPPVPKQIVDERVAPP
jgi:putative oxidoreductase